MMKTLNGKLTISRPSGYGENVIHITLDDVDSLCRTVEITISAEELGLALTSLSCRPCTYEYDDSGRVGLIREQKVEKIYVNKDSFRLAKSDIEELILPHEVYGWKGRRGDMENHYNRGEDDGGVFYRVVFLRWVERVDQ